MKILALILPAIAGSLTIASATVTYTFSEDATGVRLSYTGTISRAALEFQGGLSSSFQYIDIARIAGSGTTLFDFQNMQPHPDFPPDFGGVSFRFSATNIAFDWNLSMAAERYSPTSAVGDTFGFYIFERSGVFTTYLNLPRTDTSIDPGSGALVFSNDPINGEMRFDGQTLDSMGIDPSESFKIYLPGGETIIGNVVPEPGTFLCCILAVPLLSRHRRRHREA